MYLFFQALSIVVRDWSLINGRGATNRQGGPVKSENVLAMLKGGRKKFRGVFTQYLEVLAILKGGGGKKESTL